MPYRWVTALPMPASTKESIPYVQAFSNGTSLKHHGRAAFRSCYTAPYAADNPAVKPLLSELLSQQP